MSQLPIDLDAEAIFFDGHWYTRDDLAKKIKTMLDANDFTVARPGAALEQLNKTIAVVRTLAFRASPELADVLNAAATKSNKPVSGVIRDALMQAFGLPTSDFGSARLGAPAAQVTTAAVAQVKQHAHGEGDLPTQPQAVIPGPGALKNAGVEPTVVVEAALQNEAAVELTTPKKKEDEALERRWFNS
ncbi:MAG: hypothetical protein K1X64_19410 [Myxococcaceae bacterium]|nr:hypothetical protein [Myxococcaceae bacterium]